VNTVPNRRDDEVRRLLDTPHPAVPVDLATRAMLRGRRILRRRRIAGAALWTVLVAAIVAGIVVAALTRPWNTAGETGDGTWWSGLGPGTGQGRGQ
jgi:ferric-dicitrate binding protein FerR (iron transport regulator)